VVKRVLDMLKAEAGALQIEEDVVDLDEVIDMCLRMVGEQAKAAGLTLERAVSPGLPAIYGDAGRLRQALLNLLSNAIKFTAPGGRILISAASDATGATTISVADSGVGMRAEDIPRALTPFVQLDSRPGMRAEGAGLGLPLAKRLVELHGGKFEVESAPGAGTKITIRLPAERALASSDVAAQGDSTAGAGARGKAAGGT
jgi:signal transduction histidine kinase